MLCIDKHLKERNIIAKNNFREKYKLMNYVLLSIKLTILIYFVK